MLNTTAFMSELDEIIASRYLLKHPFYQLWSEGKLSLDSLRHYSKQYYRHVLAFPTYVSGAHSICGDIRDRQELLGNLMEEEGGETTHAELWLRFAEALGVSRDEVEEAVPLPETAALDANFSELTKRRPFVAAVAALYAYEVQLAEVAESKQAGLKQFYGISERRGLEFFIVHSSIDILHAKTTREMLARYTGDEESQEVAKESVKGATDALWGFLDGVQREYVTKAA